METEQKQKIINQLKVLRQQSISDYLNASLNSFVNKEVIEDILKRFLTQHEQQFLGNIATNIYQVRQQCKNIKKELKQKCEEEDLRRLKIQNQLSQKYEKQMQEFFKKWIQVEELCGQRSGQRNPLKAIKKLYQKAENKSKKQQEQQQQQRRLLKELQIRQNEAKDLINQKKTLQNRLKLINQRVESKDLIIKQLESQVYQKHLKLEDMTIISKDLQSKSKNCKEMMNFLQTKVCQMKEENVKWKHQLQLLKVSYENNEKQVHQFKRQTIVHEQKERNMCQLMRKIEVNFQSELNINNSLKEKVLQLQNVSLKQCRSRISKMQNEINILQQERNDLSLKFEDQKKVNSELKINLGNKIKQVDNLKQKVGQKEEQIRSKTEQIRERQKLMKRYIEQKNQQIRIIQQQMKQLKGDLQVKQQQEKEQQRTYQMYLQQIVELRQTIRQLKPSRFEERLQMDEMGGPMKLKNRKTKIYFILSKVVEKLRRLGGQKDQLKREIEKWRNEMREQAKRTVSLIGGKMIENKLECEYCDHRSREGLNEGTWGSKDEGLRNTQPGIMDRQTRQVKQTNQANQSDKWIREDQQTKQRGREDHQTPGEPQTQTYFYHANLKNYQPDHTTHLNSTTKSNIRSNHPPFKSDYYNTNIKPSQKQSYNQTLLINNNLPQSYQPHQILNSQYHASHIQNYPLAPNNTLNKNVRKIHQKMKLLKEENSTYTLHLSRVLQQSNFHS